MEEKLCSYAKNQLPGGKYWDPEQSIKEVHAQVKATNESILSLNDYLTTAIPNLHQMARSNLVEVKNKTLQWLSNLPEKQQASVLDVAITEK